MLNALSELKSLKGAEQSNVLQFQLTTLKELKNLKVRMRVLEHQLSGVKAQISKGSVYSPVAGVVERIKVTTTGVYITSGFELMTIIPHSDSVLVEVLIPSQEIGFLREGNQLE